MFKDTRSTLGVFNVNFEQISHLTNVSTVNFEQVNAGSINVCISKKKDSCPTPVC